MVLGTFLDAALPQLTTLQRVEVARSFRQGIEDAMSHMDDVALPAEYHSALLERTNTILAALEREPPGDLSANRLHKRNCAAGVLRIIGMPASSRPRLASRAARSGRLLRLEDAGSHAQPALRTPGLPAAGSGKRHAVQQTHAART